MQLVLSPEGFREEVLWCVLVYFGRGSFFKCHMLAVDVTGASGTDVPTRRHLYEERTVAIGQDTCTLLHMVMIPRVQVGLKTSP